ncbi:MAG: aminopeptidase, partial [Candidatus Melainabacteria bacterium]|nr:aminopeptidase [Candidatus Melainabacteria bacterium]
TVQKRFYVDNTSDGTYARIEIPPDNMGEAEYGRRKTVSLKAGGAATRPFMERMARVELGPRPPHQLFRTLGLSPSLDLAEELGFPRTQEGLDAFGEFYSQITHMDEVDPIAYYRKMMPLVDHYAKQLRKFHTIHVQTDNGKTNVTFSIRDKGEKESRYVASSTITGNALPGEVFTSPVEDSVNGEVYFDLPFVLDNIVFKGLTLTFKDGQIINVNVDEGDLEHLQGRILGIGPKADLKVDNFDRLGEFAIGFNRKITQLMNGRAVTNTLISEKQDLHFAIGDGYPNTGGKNKCDLHVDIPVNSGPGSELMISGLHDSSDKYHMPIYREGKFFNDFLDFDTDFNWREYGDIKWD